MEAMTQASLVSSLIHSVYGLSHCMLAILAYLLGRYAIRNFSCLRFITRQLKIKVAYPLTEQYLVQHLATAIDVRMNSFVSHL
jgi:hypothetical protein